MNKRREEILASLRRSMEPLRLKQRANPDKVVAARKAAGEAAERAEAWERWFEMLPSILKSAMCDPNTTIFEIDSLGTSGRPKMSQFAMDIRHVEQDIDNVLKSGVTSLEDITMQIAGQCWQDPTTCTKPMDPALARAFALRLYVIMSRQAQKNGEVKKPEPPVIPPHVTELLETELARQKEVWPGHKPSAPEWMLIIERALAKAKTKWYEEGQDEFLGEIVQIAASCIACLIQAGNEN